MYFHSNTKYGNELREHTKGAVHKDIYRLDFKKEQKLQKYELLLNY